MSLNIGLTTPYHHLNANFFLKIVNTLVEDLQEVIMGIAYPIRKNDEAKDEVETQEDLVESLRKLIMGKFDEKKDEFYKWSQTIHDEVRSVCKIVRLLV